MIVELPLAFNSKPISIENLRVEKSIKPKKVELRGAYH